MSFSSEVKEELAHLPSQESHCNIAELAAMIVYGGQVKKKEDGTYSIIINTENVTVARRLYTLIKENFDYKAQIRISPGSGFHRSSSYSILVDDARQSLAILKAAGMVNNLGFIEREEEIKFGSILQKTCCQRAFLRGAFLSSGSITDPEKNYHFEIVCNSLGSASRLKELFEFFGLESKIILRKKYYIVYIKEGTMISDVLSNMGAHVALMEFENIRILKDVRNSVNRRVNCEMANINKTVSAARKQIEDIEYIRENGALEKLPQSLQDIARVRLEAPEATLKELGEMLKPPVGKSGVNHRLRKLGQIADHIREHGFFKNI